MKQRTRRTDMTGGPGRGGLLIRGVAALLVLLAPSCAPNADTEFRIGAILPLTGPSARYGKWIQEGLQLGVDEINHSGGIKGKKLAIVYEDDEAKPTLAANSMRKLIDRDKVPLIFGSWASSSVLAQAPIAEATRTVVMAEAISPKIRDAGDYVFRIQPDARYYIQEFVPFVVEKLGIRSVSILYVNNDFGVDQANVFEQDLQRLGGFVVSKESFDQDATDFKTQLIKIKAKDPKAIFCPAYTEIAVILRQAKELGLTSLFLASVPFENPDILAASGELANGVIYPSHFVADSSEPAIQHYQTVYMQRYGKKSEGFAALAYDGIRIIGSVLNRCGRDNECIKNSLYNVRNVPGVTGPTSFDDRGDVVKRISIKTVRDGKFSLY